MTIAELRNALTTHGESMDEIPLEDEQGVDVQDVQVENGMLHLE